jgi:hypothetical protein
MSQQSDMADSIHSRLRDGPVTVATLVRELRSRWGPEFVPSAVHGFIAEAARCLIGREGVRLGAVQDGRFVPWSGEVWDIDARFEKEMLSLDTFLEDEHRYVFVREEPNQSPEPTR